MQWIQKQLRLKARPRGVHLVTREVLDALPELAGLEVGILHLFSSTPRRHWQSTRMPTRMCAPILSGT